MQFENYPKLYTYQHYSPPGWESRSSPPRTVTSGMTPFCYVGNWDLWQALGHAPLKHYTAMSQHRFNQIITALQNMSGKIEIILLYTNTVEPYYLKLNSTKKIIWGFEISRLISKNNQVSSVTLIYSWYLRYQCLRYLSLTVSKTVLLIWNFF